MIVPRNRLLLWVAVVVVPFALLGGVEPRAGVISVVAIGALVALALVDAISARARLAGISVELPAVTRMSKDREGRLDVRIRNEQQRARTLRLAVVLPQEIHSLQEDLIVVLPEESEWS